MVDAVMTQVTDALGSVARRPVVIGISGSQGSGKSTLAAAVEVACAAQGLSCGILSIDDLYLTRAEREGLAARVHPLLATRGVPGTHDVALGLAVLHALSHGKAVALPRFDKARDDRAPRESWPMAPAPCEVLLLEGWCVGARAQDAVDLVEPVNALECVEDADGTWRGFANAALSGVYQSLFSRIDRLVLLAAPGFEVVKGWRLEQERELAASRSEEPGVMDEAGVARFIAYYERLTRYILREMPSRADVVVQLDANRRPVSIFSSS